MATLLLRLAAPMQSWGAESKFETRRTLPYPTKSGVIGMIAAALGFSRDQSLEDLNMLRFGVRADKEGVLMRDYHTVQAEKPYITERYYIADAVFLAGLEGERQKLENLENALRSPVYPLYLGRRSCPPTMPLVLGIRDKELHAALNEEPWLLSEWRQKKACNNDENVLRFIIEDESSNSAIRDVPLSFSKTRREHGWRGVTCCDNTVMKNGSDEAETLHDPFNELR
ncbi:CRISPR system Cascade subunit CasD [Ruminococcus sp. YE71]|uniref:type I-E CRISPR-associated protein Cas5/CasD n=1 Tax=unclassified Ruminococcus TaxID=2608920 RepID=UPI000891AB9A|nr:MULTISPECIES: type I-E CRISPR-associated protein Cas5/CasD [unclassified Ruminococcus]SDA32291.1 CRISPR system Cascade subunit CasD [Ruminococcus sp. YE78]SFW53152.1 CRISPR system Cascade subunit CasD [Ruminococcus sp. YE71]